MHTTPKGKQVGTRKGHEVTVKAWRHPDYKWRADFIEAGKYKRKGFKTKVAAEQWAEDRKGEALAHGTDSALSAVERATVAETRTELAQVGLGLREAVAFAVDYHQRAQRSCTMAELIKEVVTKRERAGLSKSHISDLNSKLGRFEKEFGQIAVATITSDEISDWLHGLKLSPASLNSYRRILVVAFNDAISQKYITENPASNVMQSKVAETEAGILSPTEASMLLVGAGSAIVPAIAIGLFAGLRDAEIKRLEWKEVRLDLGNIQVKASKAKSARNRRVVIPDNLKAWLMPYTDESGSVWPANGRNLMEAARRSAGFGKPSEIKEAEEEAEITGEKVTIKPWPDNALRHSYATYHITHHENAAALALHLGHTTTELIFAHYKGEASKKEAATYWSIKPGSASNVVPMEKAG